MEGRQRLAHLRVCRALSCVQIDQQRRQLLAFAQRLDGGVEQLDLQHVEIARRPQDLAQPSHRVRHRLYALAAQQGAVDLECRLQPPQRHRH